MNPSSLDYFPCPQCGSDLMFDIEHQDLKCEHCQMHFPLSMGRKVLEYDFNDYQARLLTWEEDVQAYQCERCGASLLVGPSDLSFTCSYCGSPHVIPSLRPEGLRPEAVVTFKIEQDQTLPLFKRWMRQQFFAPFGLRKQIRLNPPTGLYLPYWTFDAKAYAVYKGRGGTYYYTTTRTKNGVRRTRHTRWKEVSGHVSKNFDDLGVCASFRFTDEFLDELGPFQTQTAPAFDAKYLSGFSAEQAEISLDVGWEHAHRKMSQQLKKAALKDILRSFDDAQVSEIHPMYEGILFKHVLVPVWASSYVYKGKTYHCLINGESGKVAGKTPVSAIKVALLILIGVLFLWWYLTY